MNQPLFFNDSETYGTVDLTQVGLDQYLNTGAESLIWTFARDDKPVQLWDVTSGARMPSEFEDNMLDERVKKVAHNAPFDRNIARVTLDLDIPWEHWWCTMAQAYAHGLPGSLEVLGFVVGLPPEDQKLVRGKELIKLFCSTPKGQKRKTRHTHPVEWQEFCDYGVQDTATLREIYKRLPTHNYVGEHYDLWVADMEINERGFMVDLEMCRQAVAMKEAMTEQISAEIQELTDGAIQKGTQNKAILNHIVGEYGFLMLNLQKDNIKKVLEEEDIDDDTRRLLELRRDSALSSLSKYATALKKAGPDGRMRHTLQYSGAGRTGRWAGRGFQPHNMPRPKRKPDDIEQNIVPAILDGTLPQQVDDVNQACSDALRSSIIAAPGNELIVGDWSNIEGRCLAWEANEEWKLEAFRANDEDPKNNPDLYVKLYAEAFRVTLESVDDKQRQMGKGMELSLGYGGGVGAFTNVAASYGLDLDELGRVVPGIVPPDIYNRAESNWKRAFIRGEDLRLEPPVFIACDALKQVYRRANPEIVQMWWDVERACRWAIERPGSVHHVARCKIWRTPAWLIIQLPSGRRLLYASPDVRATVEYDEETEEIKKRSTIHYMASKAKQWRRDRTYGGKIVENITQAIANDVLRAFILRARAEGYPQILHVHDEGVAETPIGMFDLGEFLRLMEVPLWWSDGLPLKAAGYVSQRYKKD